MRNEDPVDLYIRLEIASGNLFQIDLPADLAVTYGEYMPNKGIGGGVRNGWAGVIRKMLSFNDRLPVRELIAGVLGARSRRSKIADGTKADRMTQLPELVVGKILATYLDSVQYEDGIITSEESFELQDELNPNEKKLVEALVANDGLLDLDHFAELVPELRRHSSSPSQSLYGQSPLFERVAPSLFHLRGWPTADYDAKISAHMKLMRDQNHPWFERGGWFADPEDASMVSVKLPRSSINGLHIPIKLDDFFELGQSEEVPLIFVDSVSGNLAGVRLRKTNIKHNYATIWGSEHFLAEMGVRPGATVQIRRIAGTRYEIELIEDEESDEFVIRPGNWVEVDL